MKKNSSKDRILSRLTRPMTIKKLSQEVFMDAHHLGKLLRRFRAEGEVHICGWEQDDYPRAIWALGTARDKPRPKAKTPVQIARAYRKRINEDPARRMIYLAKKRIARTKEKPTATWIPL